MTALAGVLAPVHGDFDLVGGHRDEDGRHCKEQGRVEAELAGHRGIVGDGTTAGRLAQ
jgi:hypothetical protein